MHRQNRTKLSTIAAVAALLATLAMPARPAGAQEMLQLVVPQPEYTLGGFKYRPPQADGWRQMSLSPETLSLVYAERKSESDESINTHFGAAFEAHKIPDGVKVESPKQLAELSRTQISAAREADLVKAEDVQQVASNPDLYWYRLLVHSPIKGDPDGYEVYYVLTSPDRKQYLVIQGITKAQDYQNQVWFTQFYGSLATLKYDAAAAAAAAAAPAATGATGAPAPTGAPGSTGATAPASAPHAH